MEETKNWRELLGRLTTNPQERARIANILGINPITIGRWVNGKSSPRPDNIRPLFDALPHHRLQFQELLAKEFPEYFQEENSLLTEEVQLLIPSTFYARIIHIYSSNTNPQRKTELLDAIVTQLFKQIDTQNQGLTVTVTCCVTPAQGNQIRSLRKIVERESGAFANQHEFIPQLLGAESQEGLSLIKRHPIIIQSGAEKLRLFPHHMQSGEESSVAYPIVLADSTIGTVTIKSRLKNYFYQSLLDLIEQYLHLTTLSFTEAEFYHLDRIALQLMPPLAIQKPMLQAYQRQVMLKIIEGAKSSPSPLTRQQAEEQVWRDIEEQFCRVSMPKSASIHSGDA